MSVSPAIDFATLALSPYKACAVADSVPLLFINTAAGEAVMLEEASYRLDVAHDLAKAMASLGNAQGNADDLSAFAAAMALITGEAVQLLRHAESRRGVLERTAQELARLRSRYPTESPVEVAASAAPVAASLLNRLSPHERASVCSSAGVFIVGDWSSDSVSPRSDAP